jgi:hypothetical protein
MAHVDLRYVVSIRDRHGNPLWYFRKRHCPSVRLPGLPGSAAFTAAYQAALAALAALDAPAAIGAARTPDGTVGHVVGLFLASPGKPFARALTIDMRNSAGSQAAPPWQSLEKIKTWRLTWNNQTITILKQSVPIFSFLAQCGAPGARRLSFVRCGGSVTFNPGAINSKLVGAANGPVSLPSHLDDYCCLCRRWRVVPPGAR